MESNLEAMKQGKEEKWGEETGGKDGRKKKGDEGKLARGDE